MYLLCSVLLFLFAAIGLSQCVGWLIARRKPGRGLRRGYHIAPLYGADSIEAQTRHSLSRIRWGLGSGETVVLVGMERSPEGSELCLRLQRQLPGLYFCSLEELPAVLAALERTR